MALYKEDEAIQFVETLAAQLPSSSPTTTIRPAEMPPKTEAGEPSFFLSITKSGSDFEAISLLGEGGMGQVMLARQRSLQREVALKSIKPSSIHAESARLSLLREGLYTGGLEHPNIVPVHALGLDEMQSPVIVMKRVEGVSWR